MKRFIFVLMIFVLVFSVFTMNTMLAFAEGEDTSAGTEETTPDGEGTENGGEETTPDGEGTDNGGEETTPDGEGTEGGSEETTPDGDGEGEGTPENEDTTAEPGSEEELNGLFAEMGAILVDIKDDFVEVVNGIINFIASNETYKSIAGIVLAILGVLFIPILVAVLVIAYIAIAAIVIVATALVSFLELLIGIIPGVAFII